MTASTQPRHTMSAAGTWNKLRLLIWKNCLLQRRQYIRTALEILLPVLIVGFSFVIRGLISTLPPDLPLDERIYEPFAIDTLGRIPVQSLKLAYSPKSAIFDDILQDVTRSLKMKGFVGVQSPGELEKILFKERLVACIEFHHSPNMSVLPKQLSYALRFPNDLRTGGETWSTDKLHPIFLGGELGQLGRDEYTNGGGPPNYFREGFLPIQNAISSAFIKLKSINKQTPPKVLLQRLPIPARVLSAQAIFLSTVSGFLSFVTLFSFMFIYSNTIRAIVSDKENQLTEAMKIMGLSSAIQWTTWFLRTMTTLIISISIIVVLLSLRIYPASNWVILYLLFFVYGIAVTMMSFAVSTFFSKTSTSNQIANYFWGISMVPYFLITYEELSWTSQLLTCASPNLAMLHVLKELVRLEMLGSGLQWTNFWTSNFGTLPISVLLFSMLFMSMVFMLVTLYVEKVFPGDYGVAHQWYFPFSKSFWFGERQKSADLMERDDSDDQAHFEEVPNNSRLGIGIQMRNLRKVYANGTEAVTNLSLNMYENQITVLLGQNGAGKSTTVSMLTGMLPPTSGTALINGYDVRTEIENARGSLSFCAQHNILFDTLTVREHIQFYSSLKGLDNRSADSEVKKYTELMNLDPDKRASDLSGGMKRKLSLANALCGGSKVVLCDEPSSGMDPTARRQLWKVLENEKQSRTILLTTHYMDEADVLGDRIAIMAEGRLKCCGSSFFLKKRFGAGYSLVCVKEAGCNTKAVTKLLRKHSPNVKVATDIGAELSYHLPDDDVSFFQQMFADLEDNMQLLGLSSFGVSLTTLEDVFHKVSGDSIKYSEEENGNETTSSLENIVLLRGPRLVLNQSYALFAKKYYYWKRNWIRFAVTNVLSLAWLIFMAYKYLVLTDTTQHATPLDISLSVYGKSETILDKSNSSNLDDLTLQIMKQYEAQFDANSPNDKLTTISSQNMTGYFLKTAAENLARSNRLNLAGVSFDASQIVAWFNGEPYHTAPLTMNLVHNAMAKAMLGTDHSISLSNSPFEDKTRVDSPTNGRIISFDGLIIAWLVILLIVAPPNYIFSYVQERKCKSKLLQLLTGVNPMLFWLVSFFWDLLTFIVTILVVIISIAPFQIDNWSTPADLGTLFVFLLTFAMAVFPMTYAFSAIFSSPSRGVMIMFFVNLLTGLVVQVAYDILLKYEAVSNIWEAVLYLFPHYASLRSFANLSKINSKKEACLLACESQSSCTLETLCKMNSRCCIPSAFDFKEPGSGIALVYMLVSSALFFGIIALNEYRFFEKRSFSIRNVFKRRVITTRPSTEIDTDVQAEKKRVDELVASPQCPSNNLVLQNLTRFYGSFLAVDHLSMATQPYECFGLLGVNGAGKTTTFKMLTGDRFISEGDAWVSGVSVKNARTSVFKYISYCPQFDALLGDLTGHETLKMFGLLNGIRCHDIANITRSVAQKFDFQKLLNVKVSGFSGGNKRKLSTAIAFLGDRSVVYLDEPTAGLDPGAKRRIWNIINHERSTGKTIVLTSHSMDECEALCSRVAIMVSGEFKCLGSMQHLKNKFSEGYEILIKVAKNNEIGDNIEEQTNSVVQFISQHFPGSALKETYQELLTFYVPSSTETKWSKMFGLIEWAKSTLPIEDYSIKQTSLEQIFIRMAKMQNDSSDGQPRNQ